MAAITVRNVPDSTKKNLKIKAAQSGLSLEQYIRNVLQQAAQEMPNSDIKVMEVAKQYFGVQNGIDIKLPKRNSSRKLVDF